MRAVQGRVDTSTIVSLTEECNYTMATGALIRPPASDSDFGSAFYVGTRTLPGAPAELESRCGIRYMELGHQGGADEIMTYPTRDAPRESVQLAYFFRALTSFSPDSEDGTLACMGCDRGLEYTQAVLHVPMPPARAKAAVPPISRAPVTRRGFDVLAFAETGCYITGAGLDVLTDARTGKISPDARPTGQLLAARGFPGEPFESALLRFEEDTHTNMFTTLEPPAVPPDNRTIQDIRSTMLALAEDEM